MTQETRNPFIPALKRRAFWFLRVKQECADLLSGKSHLLVEYDIRRGVDLTKINALSVGQYLEQLPLADQYFLAEVIVGMEMTGLKRIPPFQLIQMMYRKSGIPLNPKYGIDNTFLSLASESQLRTFSLESWSEQEAYALKMFERFPAYLHWLVAQELHHEGGAREVYSKAATIFFSGDEELVWTSALESPTFDKEAHIVRNKMMVQRSLNELQRPSLLAIGSLHFLGDHSMLDFYKEQGVAVKRI